MRRRLSGFSVVPLALFALASTGCPHPSDGEKTVGEQKPIPLTPEQEKANVCKMSHGIRQLINGMRDDMVQIKGGAYNYDPAPGTFAKGYETGYKIKWQMCSYTFGGYGTDVSWHAEYVDSEWEKRYESGYHAGETLKDAAQAVVGAADKYLKNSQGAPLPGHAEALEAAAAIRELYNHWGNACLDADFGRASKWSNSGIALIDEKILTRGMLAYAAMACPSDAAFTFRHLLKNLKGRDRGRDKSVADRREVPVQRDSGFATPQGPRPTLPASRAL